MDGQLQMYIVEKIRRLGYFPKVTQNFKNISIEWDKYILVINKLAYTSGGSALVTFGTFDRYGHIIDDNLERISVRHLYQYVNQLFDDLYD